MPSATGLSGAAPWPEPAGPRLGVYVHFPWCIRKCGYCDFLSIEAKDRSVPHEPYADAVLAELARRAEQVGAHFLSSVFFGGGTPSLWEPRELGRVLRGIRSVLTGREEPEITVECNPSSFGEDRARALLDVGVNRVSLGVQSLNDERLRFLGRLHDASGGLDAIRAARRAGFTNVSADLIFGVAGESPEDAVREVLTVADLGVTHLSAYALTIEHGTEFGALARKGRLPLLPEEAVAESFQAIDAALEARGLTHYEVSNYATEGHEARHNLGYWRGLDYLGLGCGAWGTVTASGQRLRYRNTPVPSRYVASARAWRDAELELAGSGRLVSEVERLSPEIQLAERLLLGLRLREGVDLEKAGREVGADPWTPGRKAAVERQIARGRLLRDGSRLVIPKDQWLFADGTISDLL